MKFANFSRLMYQCWIWCHRKRQLVTLKSPQIPKHQSCESVMTKLRICDNTDPRISERRLLLTLRKVCHQQFLDIVMALPFFVLKKIVMPLLVMVTIVLNLFGITQSSIWRRSWSRLTKTGHFLLVWWGFPSGSWWQFQIMSGRVRHLMASS